MAAFQRTIPVRFAHCDPAAIVFYPRYFEMIAALVEDWFEEGLQASAPRLMYHRGIVTPTVHFTVDFLNAAHFGDQLTFTLWVKRIGHTSCELLIEASHRGKIAMRVKQVLVFALERTRRPTPIAPDIVKRMKRYLCTSERVLEPRAPMARAGKTPPPDRLRPGVIARAPALRAAEPAQPAKSTKRTTG